MMNDEHVSDINSTTRMGLYSTQMGCAILLFPLVIWNQPQEIVVAAPIRIQKEDWCEEGEED